MGRLFLFKRDFRSPTLCCYVIYTIYVIKNSRIIKEEVKTMHTTIQGGLNYKVSFYMDAMLLGTVNVALYNEVVEVVHIDLTNHVTQPEQLKEIVREIDLFVEQSGASVAYIYANGLADALIDEFTLAGYEDDWTRKETTLYKIMKS